jgi:hypothetical protein
MSEAGYWVNIRRGGTPLGAGFMLVDCYVLTAYHCLGRAVLGAEDADVEIELDDGEVLPGRVHRVCPSADLALIDVPQAQGRRDIPHASRARTGEEWRNPYRPDQREAFLSGIIDVIPVKYRCEGGDAVEAMQLNCTQDLGDYSGYSGSPIEGSGPGGISNLFGILIEQYPERFSPGKGPRPASKVLFAVTLSEVFDRFDCFHVSHLIDLLSSSSRGDTAGLRKDEGQSPAADWPRNDVQSNIAIVDATVVALDGLQKRGLVEEQHITALKLQVIRRYLLGGDVGESPR